MEDESALLVVAKRFRVHGVVARDVETASIPVVSSVSILT